MAKQFDYIRNGNEYGFVELDADGEWKVQPSGGEYDGAFIGHVSPTRDEHSAVEGGCPQRPTKLGYWHHWDEYFCPVTHFRVVGAASLPRRIRNEIRQVFEEAERDQD